MNEQRNQGSLEFFDSFIGKVRSVVARAEESLNSPLLFLSLHADWLAIKEEIGRTYPDQSCENNLLLLTLSGLERDLPWRQVDFLTSRYAMVARNLRFIWEWVVRSYFVENAATLRPQDAPPIRSIAGKMKWLEERERKFQWNYLFEPVFQHAGFAASFIEGDAKSLWQILNNFTHPSISYQSILIGHPELRTRDAFHHSWAQQILDVSSKVFDCIWFLAIRSFPDSNETLRQRKHLFQEAPLTRQLLDLSFRNPVSGV